MDLRNALGIFNVRTNCLIFAQSLGGCVPWSIMTVFFVDYLAQSRGFSVPPAAATLLGGGTSGVSERVGANSSVSHGFFRLPGTLWSVICCLPVLARGLRTMQFTEFRHPLASKPR